MRAHTSRVQSTVPVVPCSDLPKSHGPLGHLRASLLMKIAVWHNLPSGGGLRALDDQVRGLSERGHELHVWAPPTAGRPDSVVLAATTHEVALDRPTSRDGIVPALRSAWRGRREDLDAFAVHAARCAREMSELGPDIVFAHSCQFYRVPAIGQYLRLPAVLYLHEPNRRLYEATFPAFPWAARQARRPIRPVSIRKFADELSGVQQARIHVGAETRWVHAFDEVLVNSLYSRESVLRAYGRLSRVCLLGIDTARFGLQERPAQLRGTVMTVGALVIEKNAEFLVRAVAAAGPVRRFVWVANYVNERYRKLVERAAADAGLDLELRVAISDDELLRSFAEADVFVYAPRLEPFGLAPLEANATGLPVVAVAEGGVRETVVDGVNGILAEHDEASFAAAVAGLLEDAVRTRALGRSARDHVVRRWPLDASIERLERQLAAVVARAAGGPETARLP